MNHDLYLVIGAASIIAVTFVSTEVLSFIIRRAAKLAGAGKTVLRDIREGMQVIGLLIAVSAILTFTGLASEFTALTISGVAGLAISLALQSTLTNMISGILMLNDGIIRLGDSVEYGGIKGTVVRVALRNSWIRQADGSLAVVSNASLSSGPLVNRTALDRLKKKYSFD